MRRVWLLSMLAGCAAADPEATDGPLWSDAGLYRVEVSTSPDPPEAGPVVLTLDLWDAEGGVVEQAALDAEPWMPDMGHGIDEPPEVAEVGGGSYTLGFEFSMPGAWEVRVDVDAAPGADRVVIPVEVD